MHKVAQEVQKSVRLMDSILSFSMGEVVEVENIRVLVRKSFKVENKESFEVIEAETSMTIKDSITGAERMLLEELIHASLEYGIYVTASRRNLLSQQELEVRRDEIEASVATKLNKLASLNANSKYLKHFVK